MRFVSIIALSAGALCSASDSVHAYRFGVSGVDPRTPPMIRDLFRRDQLNESYHENAFAVRQVLDRINGWQGYGSILACFFPEHGELKAPFIEAIRPWTDHLALSIDFGTAPDFRVCSGDHDQLRVSFQEEARNGRPIDHWAIHGREALEVTGPTLNINPLLINGDMSEFGLIALHEFGHVLGLRHEHNHPSANCLDQIDIGAARAVYPYLSDDDIRDMLSVVIGGNDMVTSYDKTSIMHYHLPYQMFMEGTHATCYAERPVKLAPGDIAIVESVYGSDEVAVRGSFDHFLQKAGAYIAANGMTRAQKVNLAHDLAGAAGERPRPLSLNLSVGPDRPDPSAPVARDDAGNQCADIAHKNWNCRIENEGTVIRIEPRN